jgi:predicted esterase YcpF (UPF0227 family)
VILYLHGFRSSPASHKARLLHDRMVQRGLASHFWCEQLPFAPQEAEALIERVIAAAPTPHTLVGSSLGGLYASVLAQRWGLPAVLINPAVLASVTLEAYIGTQTHLHTGQAFEFTAAHIDHLRRLEAEPLTDLSHTWLLVEAGDEVLDATAAVKRFAGAKITLHEGGDHSFTRFADYLDEIIDFARGPAPSAAA